MTTLLSLQFAPNEVTQLIDMADDSMLGEFKSAIDSKGQWHDLSGDLKIDIRAAKPTYQLGSLNYGPITTDLFIKHLKCRIDWHRSLGIPRKVCITIRDPCGNVILDECVSFDLGVTEFALLQSVPFATKFDADLLDISLRDKGGDYFALTGDIPLAGTLFDVLLAGVIKAAISKVGDFVIRLLRNVFGSGDLAKLLINIILETFKIVEKAVDFISDIVKLALRPLDEALHKWFDEKLEITLQSEAFPKKLTLIKATGNRPQVYVSIAKPPLVSLNAQGFTVEVIE